MATNEVFLKAYLSDRQNIIEEALGRYLPGEDNTPEEIFKAIRYSVFAGGKRIRSILCLAAVDALGGDIAQALPVACALELIHTYSLIHDDLPAMDNDDFRRGKPTSHKMFGEAIAILAGDALLTEAFNLLSRAEKVRITAERRLAVIHVIAQAAGIYGMVGGQALDLLAEKTKPDLDVLGDIHRRKTAALIVAAIKSGAIICGASEQKMQALTDYGLNIGMAFQIADDILNVEGDSRLMGKNTGSDEARGKVTYPSIIGLDDARVVLSEYLEAAIQSIADFDARALPLRVIAEYIVKRKS
jgi:geranylgeranyl diphosphate synthase type II